MCFISGLGQWLICLKMCSTCVALILVAYSVETSKILIGHVLQSVTMARPLIGGWNLLSQGLMGRGLIPWVDL